jgi:predicted glycoside hydrolase/deacetylase ChbG (UPF0249 family)
MNRSSLHTIVREIGPGVTELMVHPGYVDDALKQTATRLIESRRTELELLCTLDIRALLTRERIDLVRHDLTHVTRRSVRHVSSFVTRAGVVHRHPAIQ